MDPERKISVISEEKRMDSTYTSSGSDNSPNKLLVSKPNSEDALSSGNNSYGNQMNDEIEKLEEKIQGKKKKIEGKKQEIEDAEKEVQNLEREASQAQNIYILSLALGARKVLDNLRKFNCEMNLQI